MRMLSLAVTVMVMNIVMEKLMHGAYHIVSDGDRMWSPQPSSPSFSLLPYQQQQRHTGSDTGKPSVNS